MGQLTAMFFASKPSRHVDLGDREQALHAFDRSLAVIPGYRLASIARRALAGGDRAAPARTSDDASRLNDPMDVAIARAVDRLRDSAQ